LTEVDELVGGGSFGGIGGATAGDGRYDFFVSYVPVDEDWARWIAWQLEERLHMEDRQPRLFVPGWDIVAGMNEVLSKDRALIASTRVVVVLTPEYLASDYNIEEWSAVLPDDPAGERRLVVPVRVRECRPKGLLRSIRAIDLVGRDVAAATETLLSGITAALGGQARPVTAPPYPGLGRPIAEPVAGPSFPGPPVLVGEPPAVPPNWFQDRDIEVEDIERHLGDPRTGLVTLVGPEGYGKTAMIHRLWEHVRTGVSPLRVYGLVYLSARGFWPVTAEHVIDRLTDLFPKSEADQLKATVRQPLPWVEKLIVLLRQLAGRKVIVAIDAVDELLTRTGTSPIRHCGKSSTTS
jgi:hypothetical protein